MGDRGSVFLTTLILMLTLAFMGGLLVRLVHTETEATMLRERRLRALYLAHAAVALSAHELDRRRYGQTIGDEPQDGNVPSFSGERELGSGHLRAVFDPRSGTISATGRVEAVERTLVVRLAATP